VRAAGQSVMRGEVIGSFDWEGDEGPCSSHYAPMLRNGEWPQNCPTGCSRAEERDEDREYEGQEAATEVSAALELMCRQKENG
jgi:hypothetical protein